METQLSNEAEEYIETVYRLQKRDGVAKTKELSQAMHVVPGSITNTVKHLESHGLFTHEPYRGVKLTREGERIALDIIRKHRLAECLLTDVLKAEWSSVHEEACKLEHALSKRVVALIDEKLGHPKFCPHGNPIPTKSGLVKEQPSIALNEADLGETYLVSRIINEDSESLTLFAKKKIKPNTRINIVKRELDKVCVSVKGKECVLSKDVAANVLLREKRRTANVV